MMTRVALRPPFTGRIVATPLFIDVSCTSTLPAAGLEAPMSLFRVVPLFSMVRKPPPTLAPAGVARAHAWSSTSSPTLTCWARAEPVQRIATTYLRSNQDLDQAKQYFSKGLKVAREQKAKSFELKLCLSICDFYDPKQNADKCRSQLDEIYGSFSEGFDTADLVKARTRLENA
jgi:hypothetical protein